MLSTDWSNGIKDIQFLIKGLTSFKFYDTQSNLIQQDQTWCQNGKMFGHQTMFDHVWSPNISPLDRALGSDRLKYIAVASKGFHAVLTFYM